MPQEPMRHAVLHILLALSEQEMHGLGIADWVERVTDGAVELGPGTLYRSLKEMVDEGLIRERPAPVSDADPRRKYYGITALGRRRVAEEVARLERLVEVARGGRLQTKRA